MADYDYNLSNTQDDMMGVGGPAPGPIQEGVIPSPAHIPVTGVGSIGAGPNQLPSTRPPQQLNTAPPPPAMLDTRDIGTRLLADQQIEMRAQRYNDLLGARSPGVNALAARLRLPGGEDQLRTEYTLELQGRMVEQRAQLMNNYLTSRPAGTRPSPEDINTISALSGRELEEAAGSPATFFERLAARRATALVPPSNSPAEMSGEINMDRFREAAENRTANQQFAFRRYEELDREFNASPTWQRWTQYGIGFIPFTTWYSIRNPLTRPANEAISDIFPGNNLQRQVEYYYSLPPDEAARRLDATIARMRGRHDMGMFDTLLFIEQLANPVSFNQQMLNLTGVLDLSVVAPFRTLTRGIARVSGATGEAAVASIPPLARPPTPGLPSRQYWRPGELADLLRRAGDQDLAETGIVAEARARADTSGGMAGFPDRPATVFEAAGDTRTAAYRAAADEVERLANRAGRPDSFTDLQNVTRSIWDIEGLLRGSQLNSKNELTQRLLTNREALLKSSFVDPLDINRLPRSGVANNAFDAAVTQAEEYLRRQYSHLADRVADVHLAGKGFRDILPTDIPARVRALGVMAGRLYESTVARDEIGYNAFRSIASNRNSMMLNLEALTGQPLRYDRRTGLFMPRGGFRDTAINPAQQRIVEQALRNIREADGNLRVIRTEDRRFFQRAFSAEELYKGRARAMGFDLSPFGDRPFPVSARFHTATPSSYFDTLKSLGNVHFVEMKILDRDARFFASADAARTQAHLDGFTSFRVKQQGNGWYIAIQKPIDETTPWVRNNLSIDIAAHATPISRWSTFLGYLRSWKYKVDKEIYDDMLVATYGGSYLNTTVGRMISEILEGRTVLDKGKDTLSRFPRMSSESHARFVEFMEGQKAYKDPVTGDRGRFSSNQLMLEREWFNRFTRLPDLAESLAYWTYVQINDLNYTMLNLGLYRDKVRQGWEMYRFPQFNRLDPTSRAVSVAGTDFSVPRRMEGPPAMVRPTPKQTEAIEGRMITELPARDSSWSAGILVHEIDPGKSTYFRYGRQGMAAAGLKRIDERVQELMDRGYSLIHVNHMGETDLVRTLGYTPNEIAAMQARGVDYILARRPDASPIPYKQVPYRGGGNIEYPHRYFVKQPEVRNGVYIGDIVVHGANTLAEARSLASRYGTAADIFRRVRTGLINPKELDDFISKNLPYRQSIATGENEFGSLFSRRLSAEQPFIAVPAASRTREVDKALRDRFARDGVRDIRDNPHNFYHGVYNRYALERSEPLTEVKNIGTLNNPIYKAVPAQTVDALPTMQRAAAHMMRNRYTGDLQIKSAEFFAQEFGDLIQATRAELQRDPVRVLIDQVNHPFIKTRLTDDRMAAAKGFRQTAINFMNLRSEQEMTFRTLEARLADQINSAGSLSPLKLTPHWFMSLIREPVQALKNFVYHAQLMNPKQLLVQAMGSSMVIAHEGPKIGMQALSATLLSQAWLKAARTGEMMTAFSQHAAALGWKAADWLESHQALLRTGYHNVGREYGHRGDIEAIRTTRSAGGQILDAGMGPLRWGEGFARTMSWHGAYQRWRARAGAMAILDDAAIRDILNRADMVNGTMSRAGSADWQQGWGGVLSTFWSYQTRIIESFLDRGPNSLTRSEKLRAMLTYGAMFGIPATTGLGLFGFPIVQWSTNKLMQFGITPQINRSSDRPVQDAIADIAINGFLGVAAEVATGTQFNISETYALGTNRAISDLISDRTGLEFLFGAYTQMYRDFSQVANPFLQLFFDAFRSEPIAAPITWREFAEFARLQPGMSHVERSYYALTLGRYFDRNGMALGDLSQFQAFVFSVTGMHPQEYSQMYSILNNEREARQIQVEYTRQAQRWFNAWLDAIDRNDTAAQEHAHQRLMMSVAIAGYREDQKPLVMQRLIRGQEDRIVQVLRRYGVPSADRQRMVEYLLRGQR